MEKENKFFKEQGKKYFKGKPTKERKKRKKQAMISLQRMADEGSLRLNIFFPLHDYPFLICLLMI